MTDIVSPAVRSRMMSAIRGKNTKPELLVRSALHRAGLRFSLHRRDLPGSPDIVLPKRRTVIFVHGCFWHRHPGCRFATTPSTRRRFWEEKFRKNRERDRRNRREAIKLGWKVEVLWQCDISHETLRLLVNTIRSRG